ncbi:MAG: sirohydrochlorin ferrochelatase [Psychromonas sp.]|jgi:sirohydrochlorin ferrochelatase|uniref:sirohydrochlorin chelatase n=1 Tax=Psychromonas sp. TaxID=1884585 RepID=UPI0039E4102C
MKALLLVAHGSRRQESNDEVVRLTDKLKKNSSNHYDIFQVGFLEIATPAIDKGIELCITKGATSITVLPYFLNSGRHVINDIPKLVQKTEQQFPGIKIEIAPHIGSSDLMMTLLIDAANSVNSAD